MSTINIKGLPKEAVLAALYNNAHPHMGRRNENDPVISYGEARAALHRYGHYVGELRDRYIYVDLCGDDLDPTSYDKLYGEGAALEVITHLQDGLQAAVARITLSEEERLVAGEW